MRDLDVQTEIIRYDMPAKAAVHDGTTGDAIRKQAKELRKHLQAKRKDEAAHLITILKAEDRKLAAALQTLESALDPAARVAVEPSEMHRRIQVWFSRAGDTAACREKRQRRS